MNTFAVLRHGPRGDIVYGRGSLNPGLAAYPFDEGGFSLRDYTGSLKDYVDAFDAYDTIAIKTSPWLRCLQTAYQLYMSLQRYGRTVTVTCDWSITENDNLCDGIPEELIQHEYNRFVEGKSDFDCCNERGLKIRQVQIDDGTVLVTHGGIIPQLLYSLNGNTSFGYHFYGGFIHHSNDYLIVPGVSYYGDGNYIDGADLMTVDKKTFERSFMVDGISLRHDP